MCITSPKYRDEYKGSTDFYGPMVRDRLELGLRASSSARIRARVRVRD